MNKIAIITLVVMVAFGVAVAAKTVSASKNNNTNPKIMTTEQLWKTIEEARDNRLPLTAKPCIEELRKRIVEIKHTQSMFKLLDLECQIRDNCYGEYDDKFYSNEEWREKQLKDARELWSPVREVLLASLYDSEHNNDISLKEILIDNEDILTATPLDEYNCNDVNLMEGATLWDAVALSLSRSFRSDNSLIEIWQRHVDKMGSDVSANLLSLYKLQTLNADEKTELADMSRRSKSVSAKRLTAYVEGVYYVNQALALDCNTDEEIAQSKSLIAKAIDVLSPLAKAQTDRRDNIRRSAQNIISQLTERRFSFYMDDVTVDPRLKSIPLLIDYLNLDSVDFVLYPNKKVSAIMQSNENRSFSAGYAVKTWDNYMLTTKGNPLKKLSQVGKLTIDEVLPCGEYILAAYQGEALLASKTFAFSQLAVGGLSSDGNSTVIVADAMTGQPRVGATVSKAKTDKDGVVTLRRTEGKTQRTISDGNETLNWSIYDYGYSNSKPSKRNFVNIVTDRGIYRPGQVVNYKIWSYDALNGEMSAALGKHLLISLRTADGKQTDLGSADTNAWGTVSGTFTIPEDVYCGGAHIIVTSNNGYYPYTDQCFIQIDEYKRTGINISFPTIQSIVKPGEKIAVKGVATQANGNPVSNANVTWVVVGEMGEVDRTTVTDSNGEFSMELELKTYGSKYIRVKVTDQKGETAEGNTHVSCSKEGSSLSVSMPVVVLVQGEDLKYSLSLKNDNGGDWTSDVTTSIYKLDDKELTDMISENTKSITGISQEVCPTDILAPGAYRIMFKTTLANDSASTASYDIVVVAKENSKQKGLPDFWKRVQSSASVGEGIPLRLASSFKESMAYVFVVSDAKVQSLTRVALSEESKTASIAMPKSTPLEGKAHLFIYLIGQGKFISQELEIGLKKAKPQLPLHLTTSRDISTPRAHEKWVLQLGNADLVAPEAEILASMYDARLDKFAHNSWSNVYFNENRYSFSVNTFRSQPKFDSHYNLGGYFSGMYRLNINDDIFPVMKRILIQQSMPMAIEERIVVGYGAARRARGASVNKSAAMTMSMKQSLAVVDDVEMEEALDADEVALYDRAAPEAPLPSPAADTDTPRDNFAEMVFFYPNLMTNKDGFVEFEFDLPDNLTSYNFQALVHTKDMQLSYMTQKLNVRKELSVTMGAPRFAVEGDVVTLTALVECYDKSLSSIDCDIVVKDAEGKVYSSGSQKVNLNGSTSAQTSLQISVPVGVDNLSLSVSAKGNNHQDTEITTMQVVKRCVETHESLPFVVIGKNYKNNYKDDAERLERQQKYGNDNLTFKYNSNAFVEVVDALPYLDEEWSKSADTYLGRVESSAIALLIKSRPDVQKAVCGAYKLPRLDNEGYDTPWHSSAVHMDKHTTDIHRVLSGNEAERTLKLSLRKLHELQKADGSIAWFPGMEGSDYMTVAVAEMLGRMIQMGLIAGNEEHVSGLCNGAKRYMDKLISKEAGYIRKHESDYVGSWIVELLYARALMPGALSADAEYIIESLKKNAQKDKSESYRIAVATLYNQIGAKAECELIVRSLIENLQHVKPGLASVYVHRFFYPTHAELYSQSLLTILLGRMDAMGWNAQNDNLVEVRNQLLNWLIFQKRSAYWRDRQSTAIAVLAVMGANADMTSVDEVQVGADSYTCTIEEPQLFMPRKSIEPVKVSKSQEYPSWGAWQWTETTPQDELVATGCDELKVARTIFVQRNGKFEKLNGELKVGDVVKVELTLKATVDMSFVHLRDHKAASFEHADQTSNYVYPLWWWRADRSVVPHYYQPHDTHIDFFIEHLAKGESKLSYEATVTNAGDLSAGFAEVQCVFTPELVAKSAGSRIVISNINK